MSHTKEFESRLMLSKEEYGLILRDFNNVKAIEIVNRYFDTDNLSLRQKHIVLRLRCIDNKNFEFTLKIKGNNGDLEITNNLSSNPNNKLLLGEEIIDELNKLEINVDCLKEITSLTTIRREIFSEDCTLVLDENFYNNQHDYNIEVESTSMAKSKEILEKFCNKYNIEYKENCPSKSSRAFNSIK